MKSARRILLLATCAAGALAFAADPALPKPAEKSPESPPAKPAPKPASLPDLDSLLGTTKPGDQKPGDKKPGDTPTDQKPGADTTRKELDRQLSPQEQADEFASIVRLMGDAADRVEKDRDPGLDTQRVQEDVLTRLDRIIKAARQNQQQQQQQSQSQQDQDQQQNQNQRTQSQQQQQAQQAADQANQGPARQDGALSTPSAAAPAAWGDLPAHVRDALLQGFSDKFSSMYKSATESYYRKLAEEKKK